MKSAGSLLGACCALRGRVHRVKLHRRRSKLMRTRVMPATFTALASVTPPSPMAVAVAVAPSLHKTSHCGAPCTTIGTGKTHGQKHAICQSTTSCLSFRGGLGAPRHYSSSAFLQSHERIRVDKALNQSDVLLTFLGTASCYPTENRSSSCLSMQFRCGSIWMFDCGEGSQLQMRRSSRVRAGRVRKIFITHTHGDHVLGLPGMLLNLSVVTANDETPSVSEGNVMAEPPPPIQIVAPEGTAHFLRTTLRYTHAKIIRPYFVTELVRPQRVGGEKKRNRQQGRPDTIDGSNTGKLLSQSRWDGNSTATMDLGPSELPGSRLLANAQGFWDVSGGIDFVEYQKNPRETHGAFYANGSELIKHRATTDVVGGECVLLATAERDAEKRPWGQMDVDEIVFPNDTSAAPSSASPFTPELIKRLVSTQTRYNAARDASVMAAPIRHTVPTMGFVIEEPPWPGHVNIEEVEPVLQRNAVQMREMWDAYFDEEETGNDEKMTDGKEGVEGERENAVHTNKWKANEGRTNGAKQNKEEINERLPSDGVLRGNDPNEQGTVEEAACETAEINRMEKVTSDNIVTHTRRRPWFAPHMLLRLLKEGSRLTLPDGSVLDPREDSVISGGRRGAKVTILGDTSDASAILPLCHGSDMLVHEATNMLAPGLTGDHGVRGGEGVGGDARAFDRLVAMRGHSTPAMAGRFARRAEARHLALTHLSPRYEATPRVAEEMERQAAKAMGRGTLWGSTQRRTRLAEQSDRAGVTNGGTKKPVGTSKSVTLAEDFMTIGVSSEGGHEGVIMDHRARSTFSSMLADRGGTEGDSPKRRSQPRRRGKRRQGAQGKNRGRVQRQRRGRGNGGTVPQEHVYGDAEWDTWEDDGWSGKESQREEQQGSRRGRGGGGRGGRRGGRRGGNDERARAWGYDYE